MSKYRFLLAETKRLNCPYILTGKKYHRLRRECWDKYYRDPSILNFYSEKNILHLQISSKIFDNATN